MKRLYVGNVSFQASENDLKELFSKVGEVASVKLIVNSISGRSRGFGFVEMTSDADAAKAISMLNGTSFMGRNIVVSEARSPRMDDKRRSGRGFERRRPRRER